MYRGGRVMELKEIIYGTADRIAKGADSIVRMSELLLEEKVLKNEISKQYRALGKTMYQWYVKDNIDFDELEKYFVEIDKLYNGLIKVDKLIKGKDIEDKEKK